MALRTFIIVLVLLFLPFKSSEGQVVIPDRDHLLEWLKEKFGESRRVIAKVQTGHVLEIFVSPSGSWTVLITTPEGLSMLTSSGDAWQEFDLEKVEKKKESNQETNEPKLDI